jgi:RNA exonuclease 4
MALAETPATTTRVPGAAAAPAAQNAVATGPPATDAANTTASPPPAGPSGVTSPSTTAPGPARPPAPPPAAGPSRGAASPRAAGTSRPGRAQTPCVFFAKGSCRNGAHCPFAHIKSEELPDVSKLNVQEEPEAPDSPPRRPSGVAICRFFAQGLCRNGANCRFSHGETKASAQAPALSAETSLLLRRLETGELPMYALDVECVATGKTHNDRAVAQIGLVDAYGRCVLNVYVKPKKEVVSYLTPLTGLTAALIDERGVPLEEAIRVLRSRLPSSAALVGTNIGQDAKWLGLTAPGDCALLVDLAALFRAWDGSRYVYFSQDHCAKVWLGAVRPPNVAHDAVGDAAVSMALLGCYMRMPDSAKAQCHARALATPRDPSFAVKHPSFEGVCQGNRRLCTCGAPHFS